MTEEANAIENTSKAEPEGSKAQYNFRALEKKYQQKLDEVEREKDMLRQQLEAKSQHTSDDDDDDDEPYVDKKRLNKTLAGHTQSTKSEIQKAMEQAKWAAKEELKQELWLEQNPDFYDVMNNHAEKFAQKAPKLAETILRMPDGFERNKLVYQNIKALGVDQPEPRQSTIQEKIDQNRRSPYYKPTGIANAPYSTTGDFSHAGQKNAYEKMQELKKTLRI